MSFAYISNCAKKPIRKTASKAQSSNQASLDRLHTVKLHGTVQGGLQPSHELLPPNGRQHYRIGVYLA